MQWYNEPLKWQEDNDVIHITAGAKTEYKIKIRGECFSLTPAIFCLPFNLPIVAITRHRSDAIAPKNTCRCGGSKS